RSKGFNFKIPPLMRLALIRLEEDRYHMLWTSHHILFDGWSMPILMMEFLSTYEALSKGQDLAEVQEDRYEDYIRYIERADKEQEESYWRNYLKGLEHSTLLPFIANTTERTKGQGEYKSEHLQIDAERANKIKSFAQKHRLTVNTVMQGVWSCLLHNYTGTTDVVYGVTVSGRPDDLPGVEQAVGMYINTLPLRSEIKGAQKIVEWLQVIQDEQVSSRDYQYTPLHQAQQWAGVQGDLFDSLLVFENYPVSKALTTRKWDFRIENVKVHEQTNYPLTIIIGSTDEININFSYNNALLKEEYVQQISRHFENVLMQVTGSEESKVGDIEIITSSEQQLLSAFNDTKAIYPAGQTFLNLFEEQAIKTPGAIALKFEEAKLTYKELNERANQLANYLKSKGVTNETLVPNCVERSIEMIVAMLGILKAGGAYVPVDPEYPQERISYMLEDTAAKIVISIKASKEKLQTTTGIDIIEIDTAWEQINKEDKSNLQTNINLNQLAYVIYTSGSTGKPKGVMIEHSNLSAFINWSKDEFANSKFEIVYATTSMCFDLSIFEIFYPLSIGKPLRIIENGLHIGKWLPQDEQVLTNSVPVVIEHLLKEGTDLSNLTLINMAGEPIPYHVQQGLDTQRIEVRNLYGPTEDTTYSTIYKIKKDEPILIGKPIRNTQVYIVSKEDKLVPVGVAGEICIAGDGLARGYLNREELTKEKFVPNPFTSIQHPASSTQHPVSSIQHPASRMYRTGDLGRWLPDGNIEYLGRKDDQVKIRGYRIELGEIETELMQHESIKQAVVLARADNQGHKRLVGYVVKEGTREFDKQAIAGYLQGKLPDFMIPQLWVELESMPLTPNGKIDKKALPDPDASELLTNEYVAPRNELEGKLAGIWQELLNQERIGIYDNFFELGGHSLLAMRVISAIRRELEAELAIKALFVNPTIASLAVHLQGQHKEFLLPTIQKATERPENIPLSFSQERLWFIDRLEGSVQYHLPVVLRLKGNLNKEALAYALQNIVNRHEVIRTVIEEQDGQTRQHILEENQWQLAEAGGTAFKEDPAGLRKFAQQLINKPFDLSKDHMLRATLVRLDEQDHALVVTMHHIASDGWSISILIKEVVELYSAYLDNRPADLAQLPVQYADYAIWQRNYLKGETLTNKINYWKDKLESVAPLQLPTDYQRPAVQSVKGVIISFRIDQQVTEQLQQLSQHYGATMFMTVLAAFKVLLYRYSGQHDICVGSPIANRSQQEIEGLVGFFVNTLALRNKVSAEESFTELLQQVKTTMLEAYANQDVPFEKVVDAVVKDRDMSRTPLFQVMFSWQNTQDAPQLRLGELNLSTERYEHTTSKFDLTLNVTDTPQGLQGSLEYCTDIYRAGRIEQMLLHFKELINSIVAAPGQSIGMLRMLGEPEKNKLLVEFNNSNTGYPKNKNIIDLFEEQVSKHPAAIALVYKEEQITYRDLNERSNQLGNYLRTKGVKEEVLVPICIERGTQMIIGILGILKAGGVYVPIDPEYPQERISYMLEDTAATIMIASKYSRSKIQDHPSLEIIELDTEWAEIRKQPLANLQINKDPQHTAYIIYTSGSTGKPKGVMIPDINVVRLFETDAPLYDFNNRDVWTLFHSFCFDFSVWEMYGALFYGGKIVIVPSEATKDVSLFSELLVREKVTVLNQTPSAFYALQEYITENTKEISVRFVIFGGEALNPAKLQPWKQLYTDCALINMYGITETTVHVTYQEITPEHIKDSRSIIGRPIPTLYAYIVDESQNLVPVGVPGELWIGGAGVAKGYLNRPELTAEKFVKDPFSEEAAARVYKTGDLGRWLEDGTIEYLGRIDDQVKIRGFRIELGEIETALMQSGLMSQVVVLAKADKGGHSQLVGYIVPKESFDRETVTRYLKSRLPEYMVPAVWVELEAMPITYNGKIDKKALPEPDANRQLGGQYVAPRNETEMALVKIWQEMLGVEKVGVEDNFFEIGGHSLLGMRLISQIRKELEVEIVIRDVFEFTTISLLAKYLEIQLNPAEDDAREFELLDI
ncbi:MAG: amino acid adenylation domain-containing protein, partial [Ferruginibacter sp.]